MRGIRGMLKEIFPFENRQIYRRLYSWTAIWLGDKSCHPGACELGASSQATTQPFKRLKMLTFDSIA